MAYFDVEKFATAVCNYPAIDEDAANAVIHLLRCQPTYEMEQVVHAEWLNEHWEGDPHSISGYPRTYYGECSNCGEFSEQFDRCPNCGACMDANKGSTVSNQQMLDDFEYIREFEGVESDFCGAFCNCDTLMQILRGTATRREAILHYFEWIFSDRGAKIPSNDARCKEIAERYHIENDINWQITE